jgi:hypothetical protein
MTKEREIISDCAKALEAAMPFVLDGRVHHEAELAQEEMDAAIAHAAAYLASDEGR